MKTIWQVFVSDGMDGVGYSKFITAYTEKALAMAHCDPDGAANWTSLLESFVMHRGVIAFTVTPMTVFESVDEQKAASAAKVRETALSKLTREERVALGLA